MDIQLKNEKMSDDLFYAIEKEVLKTWKTGEDACFEDGVLYQKSLDDSKNFSLKLIEADKEGRTLTQPRAGVALPSEHIKLLQYLENEGMADLLPSTIDSYTRHNRYEDAQVGIDESLRNGRSMLNGFPAVNHGVQVCRNVVSSVKSPVQVRHGTPDARLLTHITMAGGFTSYEGGGISYNIPYSKDIDLTRTIYDWMYVDRLIGKYEEAGVTINREPFGPLTGTLVPPCISHSVAIIESLLAATQGCKNITVGYGQLGNIVQDVAAIKSLKSLTRQYLDKFGFEDVYVTTVMHQWMGGFPHDESKAFGVISWGAAAAVLAGATKVIVKTPHEAMGVPTMEANAAGLKATKQVVNMLRGQNLLELHDVHLESGLIEMETKAIVDKVLDMGDGDVAVGAVRAFEAGVIDIPFAPSKFNADLAFPARDDDGAVRFLEFGNLPFNKHIRNFHEKKMAVRGKNEGRDVNFQMSIDDIYAISEGRLVGRPK
ncbi:MAG: methylaspartate mutase subunit E, partial [Defluviitaleaceae bacterium]|nr:methylaspartate mutase subunit E [Defluviitaleaceae bacterium]